MDPKTAFDLAMKNFMKAAEKGDMRDAEQWYKKAMEAYHQMESSLVGSWS
jgi:hypothetical protein